MGDDTGKEASKKEDDEMGAIESVAAAVEIIKTAADVLTNARSAVIEVDNNAPFPLRLFAHHHDHGGFKDLPEPEVSPDSAEVFSSQSDGGAIATGTEGSVSYAGDGIEMLIGWSVPFVGGNETNVGPEAARGLAGPNATRFLVLYQTGNGNQSVHMRFMLVRHPPYSLRQVMEDLHIPLKAENQVFNTGIRALLGKFFPGVRNIREILPNTTERRL